jgi:glycosyltransferase involved in cell wall biosynthesis
MSVASEITAIIPLYNKATHVREALASIAAQTFPPREIIVIDDGSTDGGDRLVEAMALPGLRLVRQPNAGPGAARNAGIAAATTRFVAFLDADDLWRPQHLDRLAALAIRFPEADLFANRFVTSSHGGGDVAPAQDRLIADYAAAWLDGLIVFTSAVMVRREAALRVGGFSTAANRGEDLALWLKLTGGCPAAYGGTIGAVYREEASDLTRTPVSGPDAAMLWITDHLASHPELPEEDRRTLGDYRARLALLHAAESIRFGDRAKARAFLAMAEGNARGRPRHRRLGLLAGPLWPLRRIIIGLRRRL